MLKKKLDLEFSGHVPAANDIISALKRGEFKAYYQPKVELNGLELSGLEVLARWQHPSFHILTPDHFLDTVRVAGLLNELTHSLVDQALDTHNILTRSGIDAPMALNLETSQIGDSDFICALIAQVSRNTIRPQPLTIEITENGGDALTSSRFIENMTKLTTSGWRLSIDDFGTKYSALERICQIHCSEIKIDQSFTRNMLTSARYKKIIKYIIAIGKSMQMNVVAEGIETLQQLNVLQEFGCDQGQGFLFSAALSAEDIEHWCLKWNGALLL
ncbi:EAL domain-containing protein [Pseudomonas poae]|uniref:EAL domain-containing protein n=1 Tax=Pseudomonas poae TaxID=200451 RepID=UPI0030D15B23